MTEITAGEFWKLMIELGLPGEVYTGDRNSIVLSLGRIQFTNDLLLVEIPLEFNMEQAHVTLDRKIKFWVTELEEPPTVH